MAHGRIDDEDEEGGRRKEEEETYKLESFYAKESHRKSLIFIRFYEGVFSPPLVLMDHSQKKLWVVLCPKIIYNYSQPCSSSLL